MLPSGAGSVSATVCSSATASAAAANRPSAGLIAAPGVYFLADGSAAAAEAVALLQTVAETLPAPDGNILL
ncbi:MAG: hypothetical protein QOF33_2587, partial [Thermomicrobiales bacterium]|nr:hypothetical protein [Thermomicrobiales bacterium]